MDESKKPSVQTVCAEKRRREQFPLSMYNPVPVRNQKPFIRRIIMSSSSDSYSYSNGSSGSSSSSVSYYFDITGQHYTPCPQCGDTSPYSCSYSDHDGEAVVILVNYGDDNGNGSKDCVAPLGVGDKDIQPITLTWPCGYDAELRVTHADIGQKNIRLWEDSLRNQELCADGTHTFPATPNQVTIYAEGIEEGEGTLQLVITIGGLEHKSLPPRRYQVLKPYWRGFVIPEKWQTGSTSGAIKINNTYYANISGSAIRTQHPDIYIPATYTHGAKQNSSPR